MSKRKRLSLSQVTQKHTESPQLTETRPLKRPRYTQATVEDHGTDAPSYSISLAGLELTELLDFTSVCTKDEISDRFGAIACALFARPSFDTRCWRGSSGIRDPRARVLFTIARMSRRPFYAWQRRAEEERTMVFPSCTAEIRKIYTGSNERRRIQRGTRKGLDLTIGVPSPHASPYFASSISAAAGSGTQEPSVRGGILLRSVRRMSDSQVVSGPSLLVDEILRVSRASSIAELLTTKWGGDISALPSTDTENVSVAAASMRLQRIKISPDLTHPRIYSSPRIGLDLSHPDIPLDDGLTHPRVVYVSKPYRYFVHPHLLTANGRGQTFLGVYRACMDSGLTSEEDDLLAEIVKKTGLKTPTAAKYLDDYKQGVAKGELRRFIGAAGKGASASPSTFLRLMGILNRLQGVSELEFLTGK